jgi:hypothetical protein
MAKQYDWTFHCYPDVCSWECLITSDDAPPVKLVSRPGNLSRLDAVRDARLHGFNRKNVDHNVRLKAHCR